MREYLCMSENNVHDSKNNLVIHTIFQLILCDIQVRYNFILKLNPGFIRG